MTTIDEVAAAIIAENTCGFSVCTNSPNWKVDSIRMFTNDGGEVVLDGYQNIPINRVCNFHKNWKQTHKMIANKAWAKVLRSLLIDNPDHVSAIQKNIRLKRFVIQWQAL